MLALIPSQPAELIMMRTQQLLAELKESFDVIIFDCPTLLNLFQMPKYIPWLTCLFYIIRQRVIMKSQSCFSKKSCTKATD